LNKDLTEQLFLGHIKGLDLPLLWAKESVIGSPEHEGDICPIVKPKITETTDEDD
jgi:hypothetical protein